VQVKLLHSKVPHYCCFDSVPVRAHIYALTQAFGLARGGRDLNFLTFSKIESLGSLIGMLRGWIGSSVKSDDNFLEVGEKAIGTLKVP